MLILSVGTYLCIFVTTSCKYIMYVLKVSISINGLILSSSIISVLVYHWVYLLYFDLLTRPEMPFEDDAPEGGDTFYERKSRGRKLADEIGQAKKFPWYTHRLMHWKRVTCELHDSYFRLMTIKHSISKIEWVIA